MSTARRTFPNHILGSLMLVACGGDGSAPGDVEQPAVDAGPHDGGVAWQPLQATTEMAALALPRGFSAPPDLSNRFADDPAAAAFGQRLFFEPGFAGRLLDGDNDGTEHALGNRGETGKVACAGCHLPASGFTDTRSIRQQISLAAGWGKRRTPSLLDVAHSPLLMWDGSRDSFQSQIFGVIESPVEMNSSRLFTAQRVFSLYRKEYEALFGPMPPLDDGERFPALSPEKTGCSQLDQDRRTCRGEWHGVPGDRAEYDGMTPADQAAVTQVVVNIGKALGSYQRLLHCGESRFDRWARGEDPDALTAEEQNGAALFVGKGNCVRCHAGPLFSDEKFHNVGLKPEIVATVFLNADDRGAAQGLLDVQQDPLNTRGTFSDGDDGRLANAENPAPAMEGAFRTPKLRCISNHPSFMHTGQIRTLEDVISFFSRGGDEFGFLGTSEIHPVQLTAAEQSALAAFLRSLDGAGPDEKLLQP